MANMIKGVTEGFQRDWRSRAPVARAVSSDLVLTVGYSHPVEIKAEPGLFEVPTPTRIIVKGIDKEQVGQVAADIRRVRPPDPYKGKGIRYAGEHVGMKASKTG